MTVKVSQLENGLSIVTHTMDHLESAAVSVWVKAGSRNETEQEHGVAHFLEHMAFKGTAKRSAGQIADQIESVGGDVNAATSLETTSYFARILKGDVELGLDILSDILQNSLFDGDEVRREQHVIVQEIGATLDSPEEVVFEAFMQAAFKDQPIGRSILGTRKTVESLTAENMRSYLSQHYCGPQMVLAGAGALDHDEFVAMARERFGSFSDKLDQPPAEAHYQGGQTLIEKETQEAQILIGFPGRAYHVRDFYASQILAQILGGGMSSRLFQEIREKHGLCYSIYAFHWGFSDTGIFGVHAATGPEDIPELMQLIVTELKRASEDITQHEIDRARAQVRASLLMSLESPASRASQIARQMLLFGRPISNEELMERLDALTPERLRDLAGRVFCDDNITLTALGPISNIPNREELRKMLQSPRLQAAE